MKIFSRIGLIVVLLLSMGGSTFASCLYEEIDPVCGIQGQTFTSTCDGWSDTSRWAIPTAYEGACVSYPPLTGESKQQIIDIVLRILQPYTEVENRGGGDILVLNATGKNMIIDVLFPNIQAQIAKEMTMTNPNMIRVSVYHHVAAMIGYDFYLVVDAEQLGK